MDKQRLTQKQYWESRHSDSDSAVSDEAGSRIKQVFRKIIPDVCWNETHAERHRWSICDRYLPKDEKFRILEIGCAPGQFLVFYCKGYGYAPWGIDYSHEGVIRTREVFSKSGIDPSHIFEMDFFSKEVTSRFSGFLM